MNGYDYRLRSLRSLNKRAYTFETSRCSVAKLIPLSLPAPQNLSSEWYPSNIRGPSDLRNRPSISDLRSF